MKTIKIFLIAAAMVCATAVPTLSAQQAAAPAQKHQWKVAVGDSVMIKRECQKYLTGENISTWVWNKVHTVHQLGTKRFPEGVLLMNIYSWVCEECLVPANAEEEQPNPVVEETVEEQPVEEPKVETPVEEPVTTEPQEEEVVPAQDQEPQPAEEPTPEEPEEAAPVPVEPVQEQPVEEPAEEPVEESTEKSAPVAEEPAQPVEQPTVEVVPSKTAQGDSIHSKQNFKHGYDRFTIGLRGGAASMMHHAIKADWTCGGDVFLDLQYAHYWAKDGRPVDLGIITGIGIGYAQSGLKTAYDSTAFTDNNVDYTVVIKDIKETDHALQLEVPLLFSLIHKKGFFLNLGPKLMIPVYSPLKQTVDENNTQISAYVQETGITLIDHPVTGRYTGQQPTTDNGIKFNINVMVTAELGYEWTLKSGNSLGLGAYANYCVFNTYKNTASPVGLFYLTAPTNEDVFKLDVLSATKTYADKLGYFDAGVKVAYHFNFPKKKQFNDSKLF